MNLKLCLNKSSQLVNQLLILLLQGIRPLLGPAECRFFPSCGNFAVEQLQTQSLHRACWAICKRLVRCSPLG